MLSLDKVQVSGIVDIATVEKMDAIRKNRMSRSQFIKMALEKYVEMDDAGVL